MELEELRRQIAASEARDVELSSDAVPYPVAQEVTEEATDVNVRQAEEDLEADAAWAEKVWKSPDVRYVV